MINFITLTNGGYTTFADSQINNFQKEFMQHHKLYIYCADNESYAYHSRKQLPSNIVLKKLDTEIGGQHAYLEGRFKELMRLKFPLILNCMDELGTPVWFVDNDVLFFKDPESYIDTEKDILFQPDAGDYEDRYSWVCTGCFWINKTDNSVNFLTKLIKLQTEVDRGEQEILNDYCRSWTSRSNVDISYKGSIESFTEAKLDILPYNLFQNGYAAFKRTQFDKHDCVLIHFNHEMNYQIKLSNLHAAAKHYNI